MNATTNGLLIAPHFFGYAMAVQAELERRGVRAEWVDDRPAADTLTKTLIRISPRLQARRSDDYFANVAGKLDGQHIEDVLVIKGQALSVQAIRRLRAALPHARFTLYFWDSYRNMSSDSRDKVALFDRAFTFDPVDAANDARLTYRPLFYLDEYAHLPPAPQDIDALFVGTVHTDRYRILKQVEAALPEHIHLKKVLYVPSPLIYWARRVFDPSFWRSRRAEFTFTPVARPELKQLLARTRVVLDIERPVQSGLTIRTLEALGARRKIITTNEFARTTDLYRPANMLILDRRHIAIPAEFFHSPSEALPPEVLKRYSLSGWLSDVLPHRAVCSS